MNELKKDQLKKDVAYKYGQAKRRLKYELRVLSYKLRFGKQLIIVK